MKIIDRLLDWFYWKLWWRYQKSKKDKELTIRIKNRSPLWLHRLEAHGWDREFSDKIWSE